MEDFSISNKVEFLCNEVGFMFCFQTEFLISHEHLVKFIKIDEDWEEVIKSKYMPIDKN